MIIKIRFPKYVNTNKDGYSFLSECFIFMEQSRDEKDVVFLDFTFCEFFDANLSAVLAAVFGNRKIIFHNLNSTIRKCLHRNGTIESLAIDGRESAGIIDETENYVPYKAFKNKDAEQFKIYIDKWVIQKRKFPEHSLGVHEKIKESIYEIYANAIMHGESEYVYCCGELNSLKETLNMTIVDKGQTIPFHVNRFLRNANLSSCDAIEWALQDANTTKSNTGGLGFTIIKEFISLNKGALQIVSQNGFLEFKNDKISKNIMKASFPGTIVNMEFNFNDTNSYRLKNEFMNSSNLL